VSLVSTLNGKMTPLGFLESRWNAINKQVCLQ
jgi:hypothetical protein